jgi:hypothetical protein
MNDARGQEEELEQIAPTEQLGWWQNYGRDSMGSKEIKTG